ncbi:chaperone ATPase [Saccharomycopsis crataegensis]|uniref:Chaperone ATPase n=1 Tax=Saccharomycopsis crataegensis TaxID=43959 RepID=A0AAV5QNC4_9ASCO|nr:chaperone ATPase [Saccharomycopsis crataegensis]
MLNARVVLNNHKRVLPNVTSRASSRSLASVGTSRTLQPFTQNVVRSHNYKPLLNMVKYGSRTPQASFSTSMSRNIQMRMNNQQSEKPALEEFGTDLTKLAKDGALDPVIGRDEEINRTIQILSRRTKNNPILIGPAGTGKTAILEGLAQRIVNKQVPESMKSKRIISLDLSKVMAGSKMRGDVEERLNRLLTEIHNEAGNIILFIDEIHLLMGLGKTDGSSLDVSNLLKPDLARGKLHCVGATTIDEYRKFIEKDVALARRFQKVLINEPSVTDSISILRGLKEKYEVHHGVKINDDALVSAVNLSSRYITDRYLPDKAIDLIDEACSSIRLQHESKPEPIQKLEYKIMTIKIELESLKKEESTPSIESKKNSLNESLSQLNEEYEQLMSRWQVEKSNIEQINAEKKKLEKFKQDLEAYQFNGNYTKASELKYASIPETEERIQQLNDDYVKANEGKNGESLLNDSITTEEIAKVISRATGIPMDSLLKPNKQKLLHAEDILKKDIVGQDEAVKVICDAVRLQRAGLTNSKRPIASFMFLGPTGTGKTQLTKKLANFLFSDESAIIRFDMSEFQEKFSISRLIGAPPGYVGYDDLGGSGELTQQVKMKPYSIVLFDEFEKAHPDINKLLLQVLDEGQLTDSHGNKIDFKNTIIILTSNLGHEFFHEDTTVETNSSDENIPVSATIKSKIMDVVKSTYPPEFINRLNDLIIFNKLSKKAMLRIVDIRINEIQKDLVANNKDFQLDVHDDVKSWIIENGGYDPNYGARPLNRFLLKEVLNPLSLLLIKGEIKNTDEVVKVIVDKDTNKIKVLPNHEAEKKE